ncbi:putative transmembrane protein TauE [Lupinus albus]|uniref:Putative transmembrane protein TauE n=1 Tax=Lupinus albus TaxID=3870 RepID=A0A6A4NMY4_LUPAL|nr:putative transmembrane protein TauE [Lupinus albus]
MRTSTLTCLILTFIAFNPSKAKERQAISDIVNIDDHLVLAGVLCFIASAISNAGGIGGGGLFIPTLTIVAGLDLKTASTLSAFMVTGGSLANVMYNICTTSPKFGGNSLIDYDIALSSEPCMLLGVSVGVICNLVFPEWLITVLFALFLAWSTSKTCKSGILLWKIESEEMMRKNGNREHENGLLENVTSEETSGLREPLLVGPKENSKLKIPWLKLWVLLLIWLSFFSIYLLHGNKYGQSIIPMEPCGVGYWFLSSVQVPLAVVFTAWVVFRKESLQDQTLEHEVLKHHT